MVEITSEERNKVKRIKRTEESLRDLWDPTKCTNIWIIGVPEEWGRQRHPTPVLLPGKSHGRRNLVGCSPWCCEELDMTERLHFHFSLSCIGEGNGSPLQCSCLENPRDGGAWWAAIYGVAKSWTWLKQLSSSSCSRRRRERERKGMRKFLKIL